MLGLFQKGPDSRRCIYKRHYMPVPLVCCNFYKFLLCLTCGLFGGHLSYNDIVGDPRLLFFLLISSAPLPNHLVGGYFGLLQYRIFGQSRSLHRNWILEQLSYSQSLLLRKRRDVPCRC